MQKKKKKKRLFTREGRNTRPGGPLVSLHSPGEGLAETKGEKGSMWGQGGQQRNSVIV